MGILIRSGRVLDAETGMDRICDMYIDKGLIEEIGSGLLPHSQADQVLDASGKIVIPGLVDMHVHLRDPGFPEKEDMQSGSQAAARGGVTTLIAMPNTKPVIDNPRLYSEVMEKAGKVSPVHILQAGAMTMGQNGERMSDIEGMAAAGIRALSEDGKSVMDPVLCREIMRKAAALDLVILDHCEDPQLRGDGCMNEDENSRRLGLPGISSLVEDTITARDMLLAADTGVKLHLCHVSTRGAAEMLRFARQAGIKNITAEVCPHHFILSSDDIPGDDPDYKMNPPLRTRQDVEALRRGLAEGVIDVISTDHAPHSAKDKEGSMRTAAFGIVGLETSFALTYTYLVETGVLTLHQMIGKMCLNPARILGLSCGTLQPGRPADVVIADISSPWRIDRNLFVSRGHNTPFQGFEVRGKICCTICGGRIVYRAG